MGKNLTIFNYPDFWTPKNVLILGKLTVEIWTDAKSDQGEEFAEAKVPETGEIAEYRVKSPQKYPSTSPNFCHFEPPRSATENLNSKFVQNSAKSPPEFSNSINKIGFGGCSEAKSQFERWPKHCEVKAGHERWPVYVAVGKNRLMQSKSSPREIIWRSDFGRKGRKIASEVQNHVVKWTFDTWDEPITGWATWKVVEVVGIVEDLGIIRKEYFDFTSKSQKSEFHPRPNQQFRHPKIQRFLRTKPWQSQSLRKSSQSFWDEFGGQNPEKSGLAVENC